MVVVLRLHYRDSFLLDLRSIEAIKDRITRLPSAWPLRMLDGLRIRQWLDLLRRREERRDLLRAVGSQVAGVWTVEDWKPGRATTLCLVCEIDFVALTEEVRGPAFAVVGCVQPVGACLGGAVNEDERVLVLGDWWAQAFDVDLPDHILALIGAARLVQVSE